MKILEVNQFSWLVFKLDGVNLSDLLSDEKFLKEDRPSFVLSKVKEIDLDVDTVPLATAWVEIKNDGTLGKVVRHKLDSSG